MAENLPISYEELRGVVIRYFTKVSGGQLVTLRTTIYDEAKAMGLYPVKQEPAHRSGTLVTHYEPGGGERLSNSDYARVLSIWWDLFVEGIVRPGLNDGLNLELPHFHVTEWGKEKIKGNPATPYDPDGYFQRLTAAIPTLDPVIQTYLHESLATFRISCLLSSAIALGCASEKALLLLIEAYTNALASPKKDNFQQKTEGKMIRKQYEEFSKMLDSHLRALLPGDVKDNLDVALTSVFNLFRTHRNEAGHPTGKILTREESFAHITVFPLYVRKVYELIDWLKANGPLP
jgi:hypothetical protein